MKLKLLLCAPELEGGISAVVKGIEKGLEYYEAKIHYKKIVYARRFESNPKLKRIILELFQLINFIYTLIIFDPKFILIESSFDKKTVLRDSIHLLICKLFRKRMAIHAHGGNWHSIPSWNFIYRRLAFFVIKKSNILIVTSNEELKTINDMFAVPVNIYKIDNPVYFPHQIEYKESRNKPIKIIFASRFAENKGILDVIQAAKLLRDNNNLKFEIFGKGELLPQVINIIKEEKLLNIDLRGNIPLDDLIFEYQKGDIFVFPSYHQEGFPMALFFAVGCGLPIIATRVRPLSDFLVEGINCSWVEERNPEMIAMKIVELSNNYKLMLEMKKANMKIIQKFNPEVIVSKYIELFEANK